jgi:hypothetical protein
MAADFVEHPAEVIEPPTRSRGLRNGGSIMRTIRSPSPPLQTRGWQNAYS